MNEQTTMQELLTASDSVTLIASGYEWICPKCEHFNHEIEVTPAVTCDNCQAMWEVNDYYHAIG